jgi:TctA family transporter
MRLEHLASGPQAALPPGNLPAALLDKAAGVAVGVLPGHHFAAAPALGRRAAHTDRGLRTPRFT